MSGRVENACSAGPFPKSNANSGTTMSSGLFASLRCTLFGKFGWYNSRAVMNWEQPGTG